MTTHLPHTFLLATHVSLLAVLPLFYVHGVDARMWREISSAALPGDEVWGGTVGTLVGAWFGNQLYFLIDERIIDYDNNQLTKLVL